MPLVEVAAAVLGLVSVLLTVREHVSTWPIGAVMYLLYFFTFLDARLYADAGLQVVGFFLQFYGWYEWAKGGAGGTTLAISRTGARRFVQLLAVGAAGTVLLGVALQRWTDQALPFWDSGIAAYSLVAQYLLALKRLETWWIWIAIDVVAIGVFRSQHLVATSLLYASFLVLACAGLRAWHRAWMLERATPAVATAFTA